MNKEGMGWGKKKKNPRHSISGKGFAKSGGTNTRYRSPGNAVEDPHC